MLHRSRMAPAPSGVAAIFSWPAPLWSWWLARALRFVARRAQPSWSVARPALSSWSVARPAPSLFVARLAPWSWSVARLAPWSLFVARPAARSADFAVFDAVFDRTACRGPEQRFDRWTFIWAGNCRVRCSLRRCRSMAGQHRAASRFDFFLAASICLLWLVCASAPVAEISSDASAMRNRVIGVLGCEKNWKQQ